MMGIIDPLKQPDEQPLWQRLLWFAGLWIGSVAVIGVVAAIIRKWLIG